MPRLMIISGGQSGVDRAALDEAIARGIPYGGWCPKGGWAEDLSEPPGLLAAYPHLRESRSADPAERTEWNVRDSDACLILVEASGVSVSGGTALAETLAARYGRPLLVADVGAADADERVRAWLAAFCRRMRATRRSGSRSAAQGRARRRGFWRGRGNSFGI